MPLKHGGRCDHLLNKRMLISLAAIRHKIRYFEQTEKMLYRIINEIIHMWPNETCLRNASLEQITVQGRQMEPLSEIGGCGGTVGVLAGRNFKSVGT